jgi:hypothetical protein
MVHDASFYILISEAKDIHFIATASGWMAKDCMLHLFRSPLPGVPACLTFARNYSGENAYLCTIFRKTIDVWQFI